MTFSQCSHHFSCYFELHYLKVLSRLHCCLPEPSSTVDSTCHSKYFQGQGALHALKQKIISKFIKEERKEAVVTEADE